MSDKRLYSEVYAVLSALGGDFVTQIPIDVITLISNERDLNYNPIIDESKGLHEQELGKETIAFIAMLKLNYWCESDEEKQELLDLLDTNEEKLKALLRSITNTRKLLAMLREN